MQPDSGYWPIFTMRYSQKQGNRALVSCDGGQTRFIDMRGRGDLYNVGDAVDAPDIDVRPPKRPAGQAKIRRKR